VDASRTQDASIKELRKCHESSSIENDGTICVILPLERIRTPIDPIFAFYLVSFFLLVEGSLDVEQLEMHENIINDTASLRIDDPRGTLMSQAEKYCPQARQRIRGENFWAILKVDRCSAGGGGRKPDSHVGHVANAVLHLERNKRSTAP